MYFLFINYSTDLTTSFEDIDWEYNKINFFLDLKKITDAKKYCSILKYHLFNSNIYGEKKCACL